jgi:hypothetical protein
MASQFQYNSSSLVDAIVLARGFNVPEILPWALYIATHIDTETLLKQELLSWRDKSFCLAAKERLWDAQKNITHAFLFESMCSPLCQVRCHSRMPANMGWQETEVLRVAPHPLECYRSWKALGVCDDCVRHIQWKHNNGREKVWEMLPEMLELGSWDKIRKEQDY